MLAIALLLSCSQSAALPTDPVEQVASVGEVDVARLAQDLAANKVPILIDVRTPQEFASGHVPGAINLPLDALASRTTELEAYRDQSLYLVCRSGARSGRAAAQLAALGHQAVNVIGGTQAWIAAGHPTER